MGESGLALTDGAMLSKSLIQFSSDGWGCFLPAFSLRPNYGRGNGGNGGLLQKDMLAYCGSRTVVFSTTAPQQATVYPGFGQRL